MKNITIRVSRPNGSFLKEWSNATFGSFVKELNAGLGVCEIKLGEKFDYQGSELALGNTVEILISDKETVNLPEGYRLVYSGYISNYHPWVRGKNEGITVYLLGHYTKLALDIWQNSGTNTTTFEYSSATDFGQMFRDLMDRYIAETTSPKLSYSAGSIKLTSTTGKYMFEMKTYREGIEKIKSMAPENWFWYVDELGIVYFKSKPTTPTHTFVFKKHFSEVEVERSMEKIRNAMLFWNGELGVTEIYKLYGDAGSITQYGRRLQKYFDYGVGDEATADIIAAKFIAETKEPAVKVVCEILDNNEDAVNGYDIESIQPGDTCVFKGFNEQFADIFKENMLISKVIYSLNKVELTVEVARAGIIEWQERTNKKVEDSYSRGVPAVYS